MKQILLAALCALAVLTSCEKPQNNQERTMTLKRADISGAKYLTLASSGDAQAAGKATTETNRLYKIDDKGNMTAVIFYVEDVYDDDGNKTGEVEATQDIVVSPHSIVDYGEKYILLFQCRLTQISGENSGMVMGHSPGFLIRKTDGAIFEIGSDQIRFFPMGRRDGSPVLLQQITYNARGELYMMGDLMSENNVYKLKLENDKLMLQQVTTGIIGTSVMVDKDDNLYVSHCGEMPNANMFRAGGYMYFHGGSVAIVNVNDIYDSRVLLIDNEYYLFNTHSNNSRRIHPKLSKINLNAPNLSFEEIATAPFPDMEFRTSLLDIAIYAGSKVLFVSSNIADILVTYDKSTQKLSAITLSDEFRYKPYNRQGIAYEYSRNNCTQITKYNIVDMTKKTIPCDRSAVPPFIQTSAQQTTTDFFEFGIKNSNGAPIRVETNLETGKVTMHEDADDRKITELIKVS